MGQDIKSLKQRPTGPKKNSDAKVIGSTKDGSIKLGHLHLAGEGDGLGSDVTAGVYLQAYDSRHYMSMDIDGPRTGWTLNRCPGPYQVWCASDNAGIPGSKDGVGYFLLAENGDIIIRAPNGRVRISGLDVDIKAEGPDNTRGTINLDSNESVNIDTKTVNIKGGSAIGFFTSGSMTLMANTSLTFQSNFVRSLTAASASIPSLSNPSGIIDFVKQFVS